MKQVLYLLNKFKRINIYFLEEVISDGFDPQSGVDNDYGTCSIVLNGNAILFGAKSEPRQISVVYRNGIKRINTLPFDFEAGRCHLNNGILFLCFDRREHKLCRTRYLDYNNRN